VLKIIKKKKVMNYNDYSPATRRKPLFCGCMPLRKGNYLLMIAMILRAVFFILAAANLFSPYINVV
jgi:hypothetical protein